MMRTHRTVPMSDVEGNTKLQEVEAELVRRWEEEQHTTNTNAWAGDEPTLFDILNEDVNEEEEDVGKIWVELGPGKTCFAMEGEPLGKK